MSKVKFYLKNPQGFRPLKKKTRGKNPVEKVKQPIPSLIYLVFNFKYYNVDEKGKKKRMFFKYSTGESINPRFWDFENGRAKETSQFPEHPEFNTSLGGYATAINNIYRTLCNNKKTVNPDVLRKEMDEYFEKSVKEQKKTLFKFIEQFIKEVEHIKSPKTIGNYNTTYNHLKNFSELKKKRIDFETINLGFYNDFTTYLLKTLNFTDNTVGKYIKTLKVFLNEATDRGLNHNLDYKNKRFKVISEETDKIYLKDEDIKKIYDLDLSKNKSLEKVRDLFVLECHLGLRFSDVISIKPDHIKKTKEGEYIEIKTKKTGETVAIPLHSRVKEILKKYNSSIPEPISNQKTNEYLKDIGELAELNDKKILVKNIGGKRVEETKHKWELITTHTSRRSFATNAFLSGVPVLSIMKFTGHRTEKSFRSYIRISQVENAEQLIDHKFFK